MFKFLLLIIVSVFQMAAFAGVWELSSSIENKQSIKAGYPAELPVDGTTVNAVITNVGGILWYKFNAVPGQKFTVNLDGTISSSKYELRFMKYNQADGTFKELSKSVLKTSPINQLSFLSDKNRTVYVQVLLKSGTDFVNPYSLTFLSSTGYDASETDDSPNQSKFAVFDGPQSWTDYTTDSFFDQDWIKFDLSETKTMSFLVTQNRNTIPFGNQTMDLYDSQFNLIGTVLPIQLTSFNLAPGRYFLKLTGSISGTGCSVRIRDVAALPTRVSITNVTTDGGVYGFINYGQGSKWRMKNNPVFYGTVFKADNTVAANTAVTINVYQSGIGGTSVTGTSDANGNFAIGMALQPASGTYRYDNGISWHYYDIDTIGFKFLELNMAANIHDLYHFAYQVNK